MLKAVLSTFSSRLLQQLSNFLVIILSTNLFGVEGRGNISLFVTNMALLILFNNVIGGQTIIYLTPRRNIYQLLIPSYLWSTLCTIVGSMLLYILGFVPESQFVHLIFITLLNSFVADNLMLLLGREKIHQHNLLGLFQTVSILIWLVVFFEVFQLKEITTYLYALYLAFGSSFLLSIPLMVRLQKNFTFKGLKSTVKKAIRYGFISQSANLIQFLNYRLGYYFIAFYQTSEKDLGIFSVAVSLSESVWLIGRSLATVQLSKISNSKDEAYSTKITLQAFKGSFLLTTLAVGGLFLFPWEWLLPIFKSQELIDSLPKLFLYLGPGIVALGTTATIAPYYSGRGKYIINVYSSGIGLLFTLLGCLVFIPYFGILGAAMTNSLSYVALSIYFMSVFGRDNQLTIWDYIPRLSDLNQLPIPFKK